MLCDCGRLGGHGRERAGECQHWPGSGFARCPSRARRRAHLLSLAGAQATDSQPGAPAESHARVLSIVLQASWGLEASSEACLHTRVPPEDLQRCSSACPTLCTTLARLSLPGAMQAGLPLLRVHRATAPSAPLPRAPARARGAIRRADWRAILSAATAPGRCFRARSVAPRRGRRNLPP
jgi:hypothetical protein